jgi:hypothetical protein
MDETPVTVDVERLRTIANRVERSANALSCFRIAEMCRSDLPGSAVAAIPGPARIAEAFDLVIANMLEWVDVARNSADGFERTEQEHAGRLAAS